MYELEPAWLGEPADALVLSVSRWSEPQVELGPHRLGDRDDVLRSGLTDMHGEHVSTAVVEARSASVIRPYAVELDAGAPETP